MKKNVFSDADEAKNFICNPWNEVTLGEVQLMFHHWVSERDLEYGRE
jgi:hypothetical protein